jgi:hypothetical protein
MKIVGYGEEFLGTGMAFFWMDQVHCYAGNGYSARVVGYCFSYRIRLEVDCRLMSILLSVSSSSGSGIEYFVYLIVF